MAEFWEVSDAMPGTSFGLPAMGAVRQILTRLNVRASAILHRTDLPPVGK